MFLQIFFQFLKIAENSVPPPNFDFVVRFVVLVNN